VPAERDMKYIDGELWVRVADCSMCKVVHPTFPNVRSFHSPCCSQHGLCASCGKRLPNPGAHYGHEIGALCEACAQ
jgi:hypothetical protein